MSQATLVERPFVNSNLFSSHYLDERVREREEWDCDDAASEAFEQLQTVYELEGELVDGYGEDALIDNWIDEVLERLGFGTQDEVTLPDGGGYVDELLFETPTSRRDAASVYLDTEETTDLFERGLGLLEAKQWGADFSQRFHEQRPYRDASHQIKHYLENTPENIQWGILTNGKKWRLYGTNDYETQTYYEVDLPELLERGDLEAFKYFYVMFRPESFRESAGTTFLDEVWSESETAAQELGEDLQDNVFTALRVLGKGFVETNDLNIDPDDQESLDQLKDQSLVLLYRLMFVLYAESRGLIHPEGQSSKDEYEDNFSLDALRLDVHETIGEIDEGFDVEFSEHSTAYWSRLEDLFRLIDQGEASLGIPPYNGGLFDHEAHEFLTENEVSNRYLAEVVYRLSTTQNGDGRYVLADYGDLDTRHLGTVYEGLLEHQFRIAPEQYAAVEEDGAQVWEPASEVTVADAVETVSEGSLYVVNDEGERKATGAYYTPDYVVTYIVEETVGPLVEEIRADLVDQGFEPGTEEYIAPFFRRVTDLRILDPAMGSGHFLTKATGYLSEQVMSEVRDAETEFGIAFDEQHIRREIAKECIYGVDLNGMAVELAKLSMWLETLAADRPLAFLDHHLKTGNSLVGSDIEAIEELESDANGGGDQYSLAEFGATREGTIERLMDIYSEFLSIENETIEDVQEMRRKYAQIERDELRRRLVAMANVHTAERFNIDIPGGAYERMARALEDDGEWATLADTNWFISAQTIADNWEFFHWKLAFPEAFYNPDGKPVSNPGFDVVLGNPPWMGTRTGGIDDSLDEYLRRTYTSAAGQYDLAAVFYERAINLVAFGCSVGYVVPKRLASNEIYEELRELLGVKRGLSSAIDLGVAFEGVNNDALILISDDRERVSKLRLGRRITNIDFETWTVHPSIIETLPFNIIPVNSRSEEIQIATNLINATSRKLGDIAEIERGAECGMNHEAISERKTGDSIPIVDHLDVGPYSVNHSGHYINTSKIEDDVLKSSEMYTDIPKLLVRFLSADLIVGTDTTGFASTNLVYHVWTEMNVNLMCGILSTNLLTFWYRVAFQTDEVKFPHVQKSHLNRIPLCSLSAPADKENINDIIEGVGNDEYSQIYELKSLEIDVSSFPEGIYEQIIEECVKEIIQAQKSKREFNTDLLDYLQSYSEGPELTDIGTYQPPKGVAETPLVGTKEDNENNRVGTVRCERGSDNTIIIHATARYKPDDEDAYETDQWGYTETDPMPAMRLTDLSDTEADLVESFVPVAVEEAGGFAGFRETATKTNSLVDRLEAIKIPDPDDVADDLQRYREAVDRAEELDEKIQQTDELIDEIVYELYGLTDEEIEIVEASVGDE